MKEWEGFEDFNTVSGGLVARVGFGRYRFGAFGNCDGHTGQRERGKGKGGKGKEGAILIPQCF